MRYRMLGPFEVLDGEDSVHLGGGRQRAFLVLLMLNANQVVSTDRIIDELWGDDAPDTVANVIQVYVSRLRKALEPDRPKGAESSVLLTRRPGYMLKVDPSDIDAYRFEELTARGRAAMAEDAMGIAASLFGQAMGLWAGEVLADLAFEDFARSEIERLGEARLNCLEHLAEARLALGQHEELVGELEILVGAQPLREQLWALLMRALYRSGRQAEALRAYRRAADILVEELGIDPSPLLQELEEQILVQDPSLDAPTVEREPLTVALPQAPPPLIGRGGQMAAVDDAFEVVANGRSVLITVSGEPGMGIGRLLAEVDRIGRTIGYEVRRARAFPTTATQPGEILDQLGGLDAEKPLVVTIANAHNCDPTSLAAIRRALVAGATPVMVVLGMTPQEDRRSLGIDQMMRAVAVVTTVIPLEVGRVSLADCQQVMDAELAHHLLQLTGGYPFEISQALSALRDEGCVDWNGSRIRTVGPLPDSMKPSLAQRVKELPTEQRRLVEASALAAIPMPLSVVSALLGVADVEALDVVEELVSIGLLDEHPEGVQASAALASGRLAAHLGQTRRSSLYGDLAAGFDGVALDRTIGWFALHSNDNVRAAALLSAAALTEVGRGNLGEARDLLDGAIEAKRRLGEDSDELWGELHLGMAQCHRLAGWSDLAAAALDIAVPLLSGEKLVDALGWAAQVADDRQRVPESEWWVARGEHAAITGDAPEKLGSLLSLRARVLNRLAFAEESDECARKAEILLAEHAGPRQRFLSSYNRAWIAFDRGEMRQAESAFVGLIDQTKNESHLADLMAWHGRSLFFLGQVDEALAALSTAEALGRKTGDGGPVFLSFLGRAEGALSFGVLDQARDAIAEFTGLVIHQFPAWENIARFLGARLALLAGDMATAEDEIANAMDLSAIGPGGRRWWLACRAVQMRLDRYDGAEVDLLIEEARNARWHAAELPLVLWAAEARGDQGLAIAAVETSLQTGLIVNAIRAFHLLESPDDGLRSRVETAARSNLGGRNEAWTEGVLGLLN